MLVNICNPDDWSVISQKVDLRECFPDDDEYRAARDKLKKTGRYWAGGGAAPLVYITRSFRQY